MHYSDEVLKRVTDSDRDLFHRIADLLWASRRPRPNIPPRERMVVECHSICRALCLEISDGSIACIDGEYVGLEIGSDLNVRFISMAHSWLRTKDGNLIDPYPPGMLTLSPLILVTEGAMRPFTSGRYHENPDMLKIRKVCLRDTWRKARVLQKMFR